MRTLNSSIFHGKCRIVLSFSCKKSILLLENVTFLNYKLSKMNIIRLLILKIDHVDRVIVRKVTKLRAPPRRQLKKKFFKKGNMVNQYMRVRLEEIEEQAETMY